MTRFFHNFISANGPSPKCTRRRYTGWGHLFVTFVVAALSRSQRDSKSKYFCFRASSAIRFAALFLLSAPISSRIVAAEAPAINVEASAEEIFVGDSLDYYVEIRNVKDPPAPDLAAVKQHFDVVAKGNRSRNQTSISIINGRRTDLSILSHVYHYSLTPQSAGELTIPAVTVTIDGQTISSKELHVRVIEAEKQDLVLVEIEASHQRVYPTQSFSVTVRILVHPLPNGMTGNPLVPVQSQPPHLQINWADAIPGLKADETTHWLQPLLAEDGVGFTLNEISARSNSFFDTSRAAVFDLSKGRETREGLDGAAIRYFVYELTRSYTPEKTGEYAFGPASVKGTFVSGIEKRRPVGRRMVAISPAISVEVREVPSPRPATFCGGIGEYKVLAAASPTNLRVGDPLTLTLEFERGGNSGSLELVSAPDLSAVPQLLDDFELLDKNPTGRIEGSVKKFGYALRPKRPNVAIPSLNISTFDPQSEEFIDCQTAAIPLEVSEAARVSAGDLVGSMPSTGTAAIKSRAQGIFQNITDPSEVRDQRINPILWMEGAGGVWCVAGCLIAVVSLYRRKSSDAGWQRRQQAKKSAQRKLNEARSLVAAGNSKEALALVRSAIVGLVADMGNRIAEGLTTVDVTTSLLAASVPDEDRTAIVKLLESIESAEYGGAQSINPASVIETAATLITTVHPLLERGA
jgi:hypothetical protein